MTDQEIALQHSLFADQFFYFFLRLRKERVRNVVDAVNACFPQESVEQKARRLISSQEPLSFLGGTLMHIPMLFPGLGRAIQVLGFMGSASVITQMHLYLVLEIALLYGKDIDDKARVSELIAVIAATGLAAGLPLVTRLLNITPILSIPASGVTALAATRMIGEEAIRLYSKPEKS